MDCTALPYRVNGGFRYSQPRRKQKRRLSQRFAVDRPQPLVPLDERGEFVPIVAVKEIIRDRLNVIRQAEAGKGRVTVKVAYKLFEQTLADVRDLRDLSVMQTAEDFVKEWRP
jgi:hypothetical protein